MKILNLGCGTKTSQRNEIINIDWSVYLKIKSTPILNTLIPFFMNSERRARYKNLPQNILVHDLSKGIPFADNTIKAVYNSHILEHIDRDKAHLFLKEANRVLIPGGIIRIVVPDLELLIKRYLDHIQKCDDNVDEVAKHDEYIDPILEQSVRREAVGTKKQNKIRRYIENLILGDARQRGETHQWMYDRHNLSSLLLQCGYNDIKIMTYTTSEIPNWQSYELDTDDEGNPHKKDSLYIEAKKII